MQIKLLLGLFSHEKDPITYNFRYLKLERNMVFLRLEVAPQHNRRLLMLLDFRNHRVQILLYVVT